MKTKPIIKLYNKGAEEYNMPRPPNFIRRVWDDFPVPYGELSDAQIKRVGKAWTENLLARAAEQRTNKTEFNLAPRKGKGE